jgi:hypothetical protein
VVIREANSEASSAVQYRDRRIRIGEFGRHSKVIEEEMKRRLHSDLK